jgi:GntR family transcriptional regulator
MTTATPRFALDPSSPTPLYHQISLALERQIENNELQVGDRLPSERELAEQLGVSRMTVRQAIRALVLAGHCYRMRGRGIFVRQRRVTFDTQSFEGFTASMRRAGRNAETKPISASITSPPDWVRAGLELDDTDQAVELVRLRLIDGAPAVLETEWFAADSFIGLVNEDLSQSLFGILEEKYGVRIARTSDLLSAHVPTQRERELLRTPLKKPVIVRDRIGSLADGTPVEAVHSVYNPEQYEVRFSLVRAGT